jgi:hypothetical protein
MEVMAAWRRAIELSLGDEDTAKLNSIAESRTEPASRVERARILLAYREDPSFFAVGRALGLHHQTVQRCVEGDHAIRYFASVPRCRECPLKQRCCPNMPSRRIVRDVNEAARDIARRKMQCYSACKIDPLSRGIGVQN